MEKIIVKKPTPAELKSLGVSSWGIWTKEKSRFDWEYSEKETCYILEGHAIIYSATAHNAEGKSKDAGSKIKLAEFSKGDLVIFPEGLKCVWEITSAIKKHYKFGQ